VYLSIHWTCDRVIVILFLMKGVDLAIENEHQYQCKKSKFEKLKLLGMMCSVSKTKTHLCHTQLQSVVSYSCFVTYNARHAMYNNQYATCCVLHTSILALFQSLPCYQQRLHEEGSLDLTLSEHSRNKTKSKIFETSTSMHVLWCNMQCVTCNVLWAMYDMLCAVTINDKMYSRVLSSSLQLEIVISSWHQLVEICV